MVLFSATNDCLDFIKCSDLAAVLDSREIESLQSVLVTNSLNPSQIKILKKYVDEAPASKLKLSSLLKGSSFSFPKLLDHQSNSTGRPAQSDLAERRKYLQLKQEDREYNKMVYGSETNPQIESYLSRGSQFSSMQNQVAIGLNMIVSVFVIFGMTWYIAKQMKFDESTVGFCSAALCLSSCYHAHKFSD
jgi:hypothetical protein